jgi:hypothetical protein
VVFVPVAAVYGHLGNFSFMVRDPAGRNSSEATVQLRVVEVPDPSVAVAPDNVTIQVRVFDHVYAPWLTACISSSVGRRGRECLSP